MKKHSRRNFIITSTLAGLGATTFLSSCTFTRSLRKKRPPFRVIYSNDTTNILTCVSPYHSKDEPFSPEMLKATVDEVAGTGIEAHFIQLATGHVPWYKSGVYPLSEHLSWWKEYFGSDPLNDEFNLGALHKYLLEGGDILQLFIDRCRKTGQVPFVSMRLNDVHHVENINTPGNTKGVHSISRFYAEHLDYRLGKDLNDWLQRTLDWSQPEIRNHMFSFIKEQCENYDIDGFELDFMRFPNYFNQETTNRDERVEIMTEFVSRVRQTLNDTEREGRHRWLCVRIPAYLGVHDELGIDLPLWVEAGVEMVNLSYFYYTQQDGDLETIRKLVPYASVYTEMCHTTFQGPVVGAKNKYDNRSFRRTTIEQYQTTAHLAYSRGLDGVSAFNFVYYREHGSGVRGPFNEPPFNIFNHLGDPAWLAQQPQHYFLSIGWWHKSLSTPLLPRQLHSGESASFRLNMAPPTGGWKSGGRLRIQSSVELGESRWKASMNGYELEETDDRSEPYENPYTPLLGTPGQLRAWKVPANLLKDGDNSIEVTLLESIEPYKIEFLDVGVV